MAEQNETNSKTKNIILVCNPEQNQNYSEITSKNDYEINDHQNESFENKNFNKETSFLI